MRMKKGAAASWQRLLFVPGKLALPGKEDQTLQSKSKECMVRIADFV